jgi:hypothetical protein
VAGVTTAATVLQIQPNRVYNCIMLNPTFCDGGTNCGEVPYSVEFVQPERTHRSD